MAKKSKPVRSRLSYQDFNQQDLNPKQFKQIINDFGNLIGLVGGQGIPPGNGGQILSQTYTLYKNLRWYLISNNRQLLSQIYTEHGIVQTLVDQPVDDGFSPGYEIETAQLDPDEIKELEYFAEENHVNHEAAQSVKWQRLYGGGAVIIITGQAPKTPLSPEQFKEGEDFKFRAIDMWELYNSIQNVTADTDLALDSMPEFFDYYGIPVHKSRVMLLKGKEAPSFIRPRLRGWGMSEVERLIRSLNQYLKNQDVIFELLDEAKVDVYRMKGFNDALSTKGGTERVARRVQQSNMMKNFQNAITMDMGDEYEQKQLSFSGLGEMLLQIRQGIACDVKMPITKLFGISSAGFSSGEDDIENYNTMIESQVRAKIKFHLIKMLQICCQVKFGFIPDDLKIKWKSLRILGADDEEKVKDAQFNRTMKAYESGLIPYEEAKQAINKNSLLPIHIDDTLPAGEPIAGNFADASESEKQRGNAKPKKEPPTETVPKWKVK